MDYRNNKLQHHTKRMMLLLLLSLCSTNTYWADAGKILFTYGTAELKHTDGSIVDLVAKMPIQSGDEIITSPNGRVQIRMTDKTVFDIQPNTVFMVEEYSFNQSEIQPIERDNADDRSIYRLVRGGFRTISGMIGKRNKKNYRINTPVATIGIRGTNYLAKICEFNCSKQGPGLQVSVGEGSVFLQNDGGSLLVGAGSSAFVSTSNASPVLTEKNSKSEALVNSPDVYIDKTANNEDGTLINIDNGKEIPVVEPNAGIPGRGLFLAAGSSELSGASGLSIVVDENGTLEGLAFDQAAYSIGTTTAINQGFDTNTGLYWGRWVDGTSTLTTPTETSDIDLSTSDAHWIYTSNTITPVIPVTGTAQFSLIANTNPSDNMGNNGVLGTASLSADFTNQTVDADLALEINQQTWEASASDVALEGSTATFSGEFDSVVITETGGSAIDGSGVLQGFFTGDDSNAISGAALGYTLQDDIDTTVEGVIAFEIAPEP